MAKGFFLYHLDETTCGGRIISGAKDDTYLGRQRVRELDPVTCGKHEGLFHVCGGMGDTYNVNGVSRQWAGSIESFSSCPCQARFIPSIRTDTYDYNCNAGRAAEHAREVEKKVSLPSYLTGEKSASGFVPDYPALRNTRDFPDEELRNIMRVNNQDVMFLTLSETFEVLASWGAWKHGWISITQSGPGQIVVNYGTNIKDVVTTSMIISQLGSWGIKATPYLNEKGTELIKLSGYPGIRRILNAPVFAAKNPKIVDVGIGKYGVSRSIVKGARLTFYVAAAFRTIDFIMNDEASLAKFIGSLATDSVKIGVASVVSWGAVSAITAFTAFVSVPLVAVVAIGLVTAVVLNELDDKFGATDKVVSYIEHAQQEFVEKAREIGSGFWDLGAMYAARMLDKGIKVIESEVRQYLREKIDDIIPRSL